MLRSSLLAAAILAVLVSPVADACILHLRLSGPSTLTWDAVPAAVQYEVQESFDHFVTSSNYFIKANTFEIAHRTSRETSIDYIVTAILGGGIQSVLTTSDACTEPINVKLAADAEFRALTRKAIVPVVGSVAGAFGSRFKTSLKLTATGGLQKGWIVYHPAGAVAKASDPSVRYDLNGLGASVAFDDIVAQLGATGVGSLDIVPDDDASSVIPEVEVRLYNDTPAGTFGTSTTAVFPFDYLHAPTMTLRIPADGFRINAGVRTLTATRAKALIYGAEGRLRTFVDLAWPADSVAFGTVDQIIRAKVAPGETVILYFDGSAIPFYTITENRTNDPDLVVARPAQSTDVGSYVE
ncbi:MAG TPA: hypothetical protein VLU46_00295 [Thermoanaerobaculia bacterium]|nr:hypothetical protein [Thermoanaerobaculia bacterium]